MKQYPLFCRRFDCWRAAGTANAWIKGNGFEVYFRDARRYLTWAGVGTEAQPLVQVLEIANISTRPMGRGRFTALLDWLEPQFPLIYIENVFATSEETAARLCRFLERRGYRRKPDDPDNPPCYLKVTHDPAQCPSTIGPAPA